MDPIERGLQQDIPLGDAASFFLKLKHGSAGPSQKQASKMVEQMRKEKCSMGMMGGDLPPTAMGKNMTATPPPALPSAAMGQHKMAFVKKASVMFKRALEEQGLAPESDGEEVPITDYLAAEHEGRAAEQDNQAAYLRERLQQAQMELQSAQQQAQMSQDSAIQMQQAQAQHEQQMQAMQQQAQLATDAAMQNVQQAHELALKATSQALQSKDDAINTHQMAAQMRMAYQDMRGQIMDTVAQDNAAPIGEAIKQKGLESQVTQPGGEVPGGEGEDPEAEEQEGGSAEQAAASGAPPGSPPPEGDDHASQANGAGPQGAGEPSPAGQTGMKEAADWGGIARTIGGKLKERAPYMLAGGAIGAALPAVEGRVGHDALRGKVKTLQTKHDQEGGFGNALMLAQAKMRLAFGEISEQHPVAAPIAGGVIGAVGGAASGPELFQKAMKLPGKFREGFSGS